ncbi:MAG: 4-hydroxy-tetrahydrodipicolinate synthase [Chloroflexota bacterium]|jgi:4-hydroxy-tetrahydrodipicolinate synthase
MNTLDSLLGRVLIPFITPFHENGEVDHQTLGELAEMVIERDFCDSVIVGGTTGEFVSLTYEERIGIFRTVKEAVSGRVPIIAGTGAAYTKHAIMLTHEAERLGFDTAMVVAPYYLKPTQEGIYRHFKAVAESTKLPVMLYNIPLFTGVNIEPDTLAALSQVDNILAIKEEAGVNPTQTSEFHFGTPDRFVVYCGDDTMVLQTLTQGGVGVVSGGSQIIGDRMKAMIDLFMKGDAIGSTKISLELFPFFKALNQNGRVNPIPILRAAISMTWKNVGDPRLPLVPATEAERQHVREVLTALGVALSESVA